MSPLAGSIEDQRVVRARADRCSACAPLLISVAVVPRLDGGDPKLFPDSVTFELQSGRRWAKRLTGSVLGTLVGLGVAVSLGVGVVKASEQSTTLTGMVLESPPPLLT